MLRPSSLALGLMAATLALISLSGPTRAASLFEQEHAPVAPAEPKALPIDHGVGAEAKAEGHADGNAAGGHGKTEQPNILEPQPSLAIWTVFVFLGLLFVLGRFAWTPLLKGLHDREEHLEHVLLDTEKARNESERLLNEHRKAMAQAADQIAALLSEARRDAEVSTAAMIEKAQAENEAAKQRAEREIGSAKDQALTEIWTKTADLAVSVAGRVLSKNMSEDDHRRLVEVAMSELPAEDTARGAVS